MTLKARTLVAFAATLSALASASAHAADQAPVQAIWKPQEINFYYQSFTTFYSCTGLEDKLRRILKELGVQGSVRVRSADCPTAIARMPRVLLNVVSPVEATPQALADRDKSKSRRELSARVRGETEELSEALEEFPAEWRRVQLTRGSLGLEPGDCELIDELRRKVLPKLAVRVVNDKVSCSPNQLSIGQPQLEVEALVALPKPDDAQKKPE
jgi:hypothetical protein